MPTVNLETGQAKPKPIRIDGAGGEEQAGGVGSPAELDAAKNASSGVDWTGFEAHAKDLFQSLDSTGVGVVGKQAMRRALTKAEAAGGAAATRTAIEKLWKRLGALYGKLSFTNVSVGVRVWLLCARLASCLCCVDVFGSGKRFPWASRLAKARRTTRVQSSCRCCEQPSQVRATPDRSALARSKLPVWSGAGQRTVLSFGVRVAFTEIFRRFDADRDGTLRRCLPATVAPACADTCATGDCRCVGEG